MSLAIATRSTSATPDSPNPGLRLKEDANGDFAGAWMSERVSIFLKLLLLLVLACAGTSSHASEEETRLKAVLLGRFAQYAELPDTGRRTFVITVVGEDPFGHQLENLYRDKRIHKKTVQIRRAAQIGQVGETDLLFVALPTLAARKAAIAHAQQNGILSVSDARGFAESGGIIQIQFVDQRAHITINQAAATKSKIKIRAPLLSIATVLPGKKP